MTYREKLKKEHPEKVNARYVGGCAGCPGNYWEQGTKMHGSECARFRNCWECWGQEVPEEPKEEKKEKSMGLYWDLITELNARQEEKGLGKYGQTLEDNTTLSREQRIEHAEEEAIDLLKYLEHLKATFADELTANDYQRMAMRTSGDYDSPVHKIRNAVYGLNGEAGEIIDLLKKHEFQGHDLNVDDMAEELGDVLWYCALLAEALGLTLEQVMRGNIDKLKARYPDGFDKARSINREV